VIACLVVPHFATAIERRKDPSLAGVPLVIGGLAWEPGKVYAVSGEAARVGVRPGMSLRQAQVVCPEAHFMPTARTRYERAFEELLEVLASFTSRIEPGTPQSSATYLDLGSLTWAEAIESVQGIGQAVRQQTHLAPALGLAGAKFPAQVAATAARPNEALLIAPGHEAAFLAPLSVNYLPLNAETARRLRLLGIRSLGQLAALPAGAALLQFGAEGRLLHQLAQGCDHWPILPHPPGATERVTRQLDGPVADWAILTAVARALAGELAARLQANGQAGRELWVIVHLEDGTTREEGGALRRPASGAEDLARALAHRLARVEYTCGVVGLEVVLANLVPATGQQLDLFVHQTGQASRLGDVLKNLIARYGADCFYQASLADRQARLPEQRFRLREVAGL
jgi:nucleotidyltransferase/DNA polymerase involved in DNA repair